jgi:hypothetical protein
MIKKIIKERLHILLESKDYRVVPQDYKKEFGQTGSGKAIFGKPNIAKASNEDTAKALYKIKEAKQIVRAYKEAYLNGVPDSDGIIRFNIDYQNKKYECKIPPQFKNKTSIGGRSVNYLYYFDDPNTGDGAIEMAMDKSGYMTAKQLRSKPDIEQSPDLTGAADAGYEKEYEGRTKYFRVKVGVMGKEGEKYYSVFPSPAIDANIKTNFIFSDEIISFMQGGFDYTSDEKGEELANKMELTKKIEKIRKDSELILGRPISSNSEWLKFKERLIRLYGNDKSLFDLDMNTETNNFVDIYKNKNLFKQVGKPEIGLPKDEMDTWEKEQKEKLARIAAARARMKK